MIADLHRKAARAMCLVATLAFASCAGDGTLGANPVQPVRGEAASAVNDIAAWREAVQLSALPGAGCFQAAYPSRRWSRIACAAPFAHRFFAPSARLRPHSVNGAEWNLQAPHGDTIASAIGSFPQANVTGEKSNSGSGSPTLSNAYTFQINSNFYNNPVACKGVPNCGSGWVQFVFTNPVTNPYGSPPQAGLTVWNIISPKPGTSIGTCPGGGPPYQGSCYQYGPAVLLSNQSISKNALQGMAIRGSSGTNGSGDPYLSVYLTTGKLTVGIEWANPQLSDLPQRWKSAQFNVLGHDGGSKAIFSPGTTITARLATQFASGSNAAPTCTPGASTTAETNNLPFVAAPPSKSVTYPSIVFKQSNAIAPGNASCLALPGYP